MSGGRSPARLDLALARRPRLLVLDEPMAMLDPLARHDFMATVMTAVADDGVSVVLSSHVLAELERVCRLPRAPLARSVQMVVRSMISSPPSRAHRPSCKSSGMRSNGTSCTPAGQHHRHIARPA